MDKDYTVGTFSSQTLDFSTLNSIRARSNDLLYSGVDGLVNSMQAWSFRESDEARSDLSLFFFSTKIA